MRASLTNLLEHHYGKEAFQASSQRGPDCLPLRVLADAPSMKVRLSPEEYAHVAGCAACLHSMALSMRSQCPSEDFLSAYGGGQSPIAAAVREHVETQDCRRCRESFAGELSQPPVASAGVAATDASTEAAPLRRASFTQLWNFFRLRSIVTPLLVTGLVTAALLVAVWLGVNNRRLRSEHARSDSQGTNPGANPQANASAPDRQHTTSNGSAQEESGTGAAKEHAQPDTQQKTAASLAFVLSPGTMRGDGGAMQRLVIPATGVDRVDLNLKFTPYTKYSTYRVIVSLADETVLLSRDLPGKLASGGKLALGLPAASLPAGDYTIVVQGQSGTAAYEDVDAYSFRVVRGLDLR